MEFTLGEILEHCDDWEAFCDKYGWDYYAVNEGGGDIKQSLSVVEMDELGILDKLLKNREEVLNDYSKHT